ncbi:MAG: AbrB/MazE/SpoVT family DNA-binding domain-containing protein [Smithellaceae bacterium]|jgi:AbrB family looped-hinge helix DNA binding protein|nr:AbrB/MazE/SpoVT family DNA-binding domain-containing protein [Smithellaceae bacterium]
MLSTVTTKGQVTIPKPIRDALGIGPNDRITFIQEGERVLLQPVRALKSFRGAVKTKGPGSFDEERAHAKTAVAGRNKEENE